MKCPLSYLTFQFRIVYISSVLLENCLSCFREDADCRYDHKFDLLFLNIECYKTLANLLLQEVFLRDISHFSIFKRLTPICMLSEIKSIYRWGSEKSVQNLFFLIILSHSQGSGNFDSPCRSFYQTLADVSISLLHAQIEN